MALHRIDNAKDKNFWSARVGRDIRLIIHKTESAFCSGDADRDWFRLGRDVHELYSVSKSVTQNVYSDGNAGSRFDGRHDAIITVVLLDHPRLLFRLRKDAREIVVEIRMIFSDHANHGSAATSACCSASSEDSFFITESRHKDENDKSQTNERGKATEMVSTATSASS